MNYTELLTDIADIVVICGGVAASIRFIQAVRRARSQRPYTQTQQNQVTNKTKMADYLFRIEWRFRLSEKDALFTYFFGWVFLSLAFLGFINASDMSRLDLNVDLAHKILYLIVGLAVVGCSFIFRDYSILFCLYNCVLGTAFLIIAGAGFIYPSFYVNYNLFAFTYTNRADTIIHLIIGILALLLGSFTLIEELSLRRFRREVQQAQLKAWNDSQR